MFRRAVLFSGSVLLVALAVLAASQLTDDHPGDRDAHFRMSAAAIAGVLPRPVENMQSAKDDYGLADFFAEAGIDLGVPATLTPTSTATATATRTATPTATATRIVIVSTSTSTPAPTSTSTPNPNLDVTGLLPQAASTQPPSATPTRTAVPATSLPTQPAAGVGAAAVLPPATGDAGLKTKFR